MRFLHSMAAATVCTLLLSGCPSSEEAPTRPTSQSNPDAEARPTAEPAADTPAQRVSVLPPVIYWDEWIERALKTPETEPIRENVAALGRELAGDLPLERLADPGGEPEWAAQRDLAVNDHEVGARLAFVLPLVAAASRLSDDTALLETVIAQLESIARWEPWQRYPEAWGEPPETEPAANGSTPSGEATAATPDIVPEEAAEAEDLPLQGDAFAATPLETGPATALMARAVVETLEILGAESLPTDVSDALQARITVELNHAEDYAYTRESTREPPFLPLHLAETIILLGPISRPERMDDLSILTGKLVQPLLREDGFAGSLGPLALADARFAEQLLAVARGLLATGDETVRDSPAWSAFVRSIALRRFAAQPLSLADIDRGQSPADLARIHGAVCATFLVSGQTDALWTSRNIGAQPASLAALAVATHVARHVPPEPTAPRSFGGYGNAGWTVWRSAWRPTASAIALFAGSDADDRAASGHFVYYWKGRPIIADTAGGLENTVRVNELPHESGSGSLLVRDVSLESGSARIVAGSVHPNLNSWNRDIFWTETGLRVTDSIAFELGRRGRLSIAWNLAGSEAPTIRGGARRMRLRWPGADMEIQCTQTPETEIIDTGTVVGTPEGPVPVHQLILRFPDNLRNVRLTTRLFPRPLPAPPADG